MSPSQAKKKQHKRYDSVARDAVRGRAGYKPAVKSPLSKSPSKKVSHSISFA